MRKPGTVKPPSTRQLRAGEMIRRALIEVLAEGHVRDPDLAGASITVSEVRAAPDLKHASAFVLPLGGGDAGPVLAALRRARAFLRGEVARRVQLRHAPELHFELDRSFDQGARIDALAAQGYNAARLGLTSSEGSSWPPLRSRLRHPSGFV